MPIDIGVIIVSAVVSNALGSVFGNFFNRFGSGDRRTLETFLATLSTDFVHRVENVVRDAFTSQNFLEVKTDITTAATAFRTFQASEGMDGTQLDTASNSVLAARSRLFAVTREICAFSENKKNIQIADPVAKGASALQHSRALEASMAALQAIAALDLLVLAKKTERYPALRAEVVNRVNEYKALATQLKEQYVGAQSFRQWVQWDHNILNIPSVPGTFGGTTGGGGTRCHFKALYYRDGNVINKMEKVYPETDRVQAEKLKGEFQSQASWAADDKWIVAGDRGSIYDAAERRVDTDPGNIKEAIETWEAVRVVFAN